MFADRVNWLLRGHGKGAAGLNMHRERSGVQGCSGCVQQVEERLESPSLVWVVALRIFPASRTNLGLRCQHHELVFNKKLSCYENLCKIQEQFVAVPSVP